ncbi:MAG: hypothetical protein HKL96_12425 [Phycisphaerales bacterium]|nr:hypothetical protein [Phycisphaerales bacterium]
MVFVKKIRRNNRLTPMLLMGVCLLTLVGAAARLNGQVVDRAGLFSAAVVNQANAMISSLAARTHKQLLIETYAAIPQSLAGSYDPAQKNTFFANWADNVARQQRLNGVIVLICRKPGHLTVQAGQSTLRTVFMPSERDKAAQLLLAAFKVGKFDDGLLGTTRYITQTIMHNAQALSAAAMNSSPTNVPANMPVPMRPAKQHSNSMLIWIILLVVGAIMLWLVFRPRSQAQPPVYGQGGGLTPSSGPGTAPMAGQAPSGPGLGSTFMTGLVGGAIGAAAGNMVYDAMRGGGNAATGAPPMEPGGMPAGQASMGVGDAGANLPTDTASDWTSGDANSGGDFGSTDAGDASSDLADSGGSFDDSGGDTGGGDMDDNSGGDF